MASAPDTMVVYKPSGSKRIEEGKVVGRLGYSHGWTLWSNFTSIQKPWEVALGYGCRGYCDDSPEEEVGVMCIIWHESGCRRSLVRRADGSLAPAGFIRQQGGLAWQRLSYTPASALMPSPMVLDELLRYVQLSPSQVNKKRLMVENGIERNKGSSLRRYQDKRKREAATNQLNHQAHGSSTTGGGSGLVGRFQQSATTGGEMQAMFAVVAEIEHPPPPMVHTAPVEETRTARAPPERLVEPQVDLFLQVDLALLSGLAASMAAEESAPEVEIPVEVEEDMEVVPPPQDSSSQPKEGGVEGTRTAQAPPEQIGELALLTSMAERVPTGVSVPEVETPEEEVEEVNSTPSSSGTEEEEEESRFKRTMLNGVRLARNVVPTAMCKELADEITKIDRGE